MSKAIIKSISRAAAPALLGYELNNVFHENRPIQYQNNNLVPSANINNSPRDYTEFFYLIIVLLIVFIVVIAFKMLKRGQITIQETV